MKHYVKLLTHVVLIGFIFLLIISASAFGASYYVDTAGTDKIGCGDGGYGKDACATPAYVIENIGVSRGDTIYINDGTYTKYGKSGSFDYIVEIDGALSSTGYLTIKARNDNKVVFDLEKDGSGDYIGYCALVKNTTGVKFVGINFTRCGYGGARLATNGISGPSNDIWFDKCKFYNIGRGYSGQAHGKAYFSALVGTNKSTGKITPIKVTRSEFYNIGRQDPEKDDGYDHAIYATGSFTIENSIIRDQYAGYHIKFAGGDYIVVNNIFAEQHTSGITGGAFYFSGVRNYAIFKNNAFTDIKADSFYGRGGACNGTGDAAKISWYNNMSDVDISGSGYCQDVSNGWAADSGNVSGKKQVDLGFTNVDKDDYSITGSSHLVGAGTANGAPEYDFLGTPRPKEAPAIGAYENNSHPDNNDPLQAPTGLKIIGP